MRVQGDPVPANNGVFYLLGDHLGSTSIVADSSGSKVSDLRYRAFGETRFAWGTTPTDYRYTGQREESLSGLYDYGARWYDATAGRFTQADSTIAMNANPQALDRYAYALNSPLKYTDPTGHKACSDIDRNGECVVDLDWRPGQSQRNPESDTEDPIQVTQEEAMKMAIDVEGKSWAELSVGERAIFLAAGWSPAEYRELAGGNAPSVEGTLQDPGLWLAVGAAGGMNGPALYETGQALVYEAAVWCFMTPLCAPLLGVPSRYDLGGKTDLWHQYPRLYDPMILSEGSREIASYNYVILHLEGWVNDTAGRYELGVVMRGLQQVITHRLFRGVK